jgi:hypothetical protein
METSMKFLFGFILMLACLSAVADEQVHMNNGMTCWRNDQGHLWGCSGGVDDRSGGFTDTESGTRYQYNAPRRAIDPNSGAPVYTPDVYGHSRRRRNDE